MDDRTLVHVTLSTGHVRDSPRSEVSKETIDALAPVLEQLLAGDEIAVPWVSGDYTINGAAGGDCFIATIWSRGGAPVVTIGCARGPREAVRLWEQLHATAVIDELQPQTIAGAAPLGERWCAARLEIGIAAHPDTAHWLGDFERCLAWTWIDRGRGLQTPLPAPRARVQRPIATPGRARRHRWPN